ncbi:MAG TPA: MarR family transcriptional regulator [Verrucomicrobiae bacterium]|jgi:MarR family transcriptional regulator for hemolysin|nr:MarR family transcriptional regulator [Verrucomicrobiae bacterium]
MREEFFYTHDLQVKACILVSKPLLISILFNSEQLMNAGNKFALKLGHVSRKWRTRLNARLLHTGLSQARWITLLRLSILGPISQNELAGDIGVEGPTLVRLLDGLESQGLVERKALDGDRRVKCVHLTKSAEPVLKEITRISDELRSEVLDGIPLDDIATALRVLQAIAERLERK